MPLVGVGLLYQQGYFRQYLNQAGWQQEDYTDNDFHNLPLTLERRSDGTPLTVEVPYPDRPVVAQVWRAQVGRVPLYLLDTNLPANRRPEDRDITDQLYGGDTSATLSASLEMRIQQESLLGIDGYRTLEALGLEPAVYHMNEGHSAFLALERMRRLMEAQGLAFAEAREAASAGLVFTTHTPVPAGQDYFSPDLMDRYFGDYARNLGLSRQEFLALGRQDPNNSSEPFCMTILALRLAAYSNGVSRLHGQHPEGTRCRMWQGIWPGVPEDEIPIGHVTNGVYFRSWISHEMNQLYDRYLGPRWREEPAAEEQRSGGAGEQGGTGAFTPAPLHLCTSAPLPEVLDPEALTIGFARRFAPHKRPTLLLRDPERLARLLDNPERPAQVIPSAELGAGFAGKAHPRDEAGKELIRQIVGLSRQERFRRRVVFLEDYDMAVARYLVQGSDVWLNTPRRPREASGTSGTKATATCATSSTPTAWRKRTPSASTCRPWPARGRR